MQGSSTSHQLVETGRRWWWLVVGAAVLGSLVTLLIAGQVTPTYDAQASIRRAPIVGMEPLSRGDILARFMDDTAQRILIELAIRDAHLTLAATELRSRTHLELPADAAVIEIRTSADDIPTAKASADAIARALLASDDPVFARSLQGAVLVDRAEVVRRLPAAEIEKALLGGFLMLFVAIDVVIAIEYLERRGVIGGHPAG